MLDYVSHLLDDLVTYAGLNPWIFIFCSLLILSPVFAISAYLNQQLATDIDNKLLVHRTRLQRLIDLCEMKENYEGEVDISSLGEQSSCAPKESST